MAQFAAQKVIELGGKVLSLSDSGGSILDPGGINSEKLDYVMDLKNNRRGRISEYAAEYGVRYFEGKRPWMLADADVALPCATQNELNLEEAESLVRGGCVCVSEGANMPTTPEATDFFVQKNILFGPGKAANAGGVATSGLEMSQNSMRLKWTREEVDSRLKQIMTGIHSSCVEASKMAGTPGNYVNGANIAGFLKVADSMIDQGVV